MRNSFIVLALCSIFAFIGCDKKVEMPSRATLDSVAKVQSGAERIDLEDLCYVHGIVDSVLLPERVGLDIRDSLDLIVANMADYKNELSVFETHVVNDSIFIVEEFNPMRETLKKKTNDSRTESHVRKYIFHKNGDIEIKMGNCISEEYDPNNEDVLITMYVDGKTGLVVGYKKSDFGLDNSYVITKDGKVVIGHDYGYAENSATGKFATDLFGTLRDDVEKTILAYSKSRK